ncbi:MAG: TrkA family potassium uptake protein [Muribaculaceae bacterium]|nr:TrkA family potassium uptake protein [Muribaculaceae bacterium]
MKFLIIGLGIYGENLARDLTDMGHEVIGADIRRSAVESVKNYISTVYVLDSSEESQLEVLPLRNVDLVIVAIGENFGASIKTVALLKKAGVKHIYSRAIDPLQQAILEGFNIDRIITPEQRAANDLAHEMELGVKVRTLSVDPEHAVINFAANEYLFGLLYSNLKERLKENYDITLVAASRPAKRTNIMGISRETLTKLDLDGDSSLQVEKGDNITVFGSKSRLRELCRKIS